MPRKKKTPVVTPAIDLPKEFLEKLIPGPMDAAGVEAVFSYAGRTHQPVPQPLPVRVGGFGGAAQAFERREVGVGAQILRDLGVRSIVTARSSKMNSVSPTGSLK